MSISARPDAAPVVAYPAAPGAASRPLSQVLAPVITIAVGIGVDLAFDPVHHHVPLCPLHALTGIWCPFCGGLRAVYLLFHGDIAGALSANLLLFIAVPWLAWRWIQGWRGRAPRPLPGPTWWPTVAVIVVLAAFTVVRNLPFGALIAPSGG